MLGGFLMISEGVTILAGSGSRVCFCYVLYIVWGIKKYYYLRALSIFPAKLALWNLCVTVNLGYTRLIIIHPLDIGFAEFFR